MRSSDKLAWNSEVREWLEDHIPNLTNYQKGELFNVVDECPFAIYTSRRYKKPKPLWRTTLPLFLATSVCMWVFMPFKYLFTGRFGYGEGRVLNFHNTWHRKLFGR
jgi:hypothetical protein